MDPNATPQAGASPAEPETLTAAMQQLVDAAAVDGRRYLNGEELQSAALARWPHLATTP